MIKHVFIVTKRAALAGAAVLALGAIFEASAALAQGNGDFYKGKTIKLVVGYGPGGGYDAYARMLAGPIGKKFDATVIVENQPGAGGVNALNRIYSAKGDAQQMMIVNGTAAAMAQLVGQTGVRYDLAKMSHLGTIASSPWVWLVHSKSPIKTPQDAMKHKGPIRWSASGPIDGLADGAWVTCEALKLNCNVIIGYKGSNDAARAVMQGEMDAIYVSDTSAQNYAATGDVRAVAVMNRKPSRFFPDVKTIFEAVPVSKEGQWLIDFHATVEDLGRILVMPPGVASAQLQAMQKAVMDVLNDEEIKAMGAKSKRYVEPVDAAGTLKNVKAVVEDMTDAQRKRLRQVMRLDPS